MADFANSRIFFWTSAGISCVGRVLHVAPVDVVRRQPLLGVRREHGRKEHRAGALRAVEAPDRLDRLRVEIHDLRAVAPAGGHAQRDLDALFLEFPLAARRFGHAADGRIGDDDLHGRPVRIAQVLGNQPGRRLGHAHRLVFQPLADAVAPAVYAGTNPSFGNAI